MIYFLILGFPEILKALPIPVDKGSSILGFAL